MPTAAELYALERAARLQRSRMMGDLLAKGTKAIARRVANVFTVKEPHHA
jgi:hypothetical protein